MADLTEKERQEIETMINDLVARARKASEEYNCKRIVLTGGDSEYLISKMCDSKMMIDRHLDLVAEGLNRILLYNENN